MRILKIFDGDYPWDVRVEKILRSLARAGHEVVLLARNSRGDPHRERSEDATIRRLPRAGRLEPAVGFPAFFNPTWVREGLRAMREERPERIVVRDLPLAPLALWLGARSGVPVIVDMAEPYPEALRSNWQFDDLGGLDHLLRSPRLADAVERWVLRRAARVLVVSPEAGERLERVGLPPGRWTLVGNTPPLAGLEPGGEPARMPPEFRSGTVLLFSGILVGDRGVEVALRGLAALRGERASSVRLVVIGDGPARPRYEAEVARLGLRDRVRLLGWLPHQELPAYWRAADVGLLPFHDCVHIQTTLANKLFDYMAVGLPVLASDARPMARVLGETGAGVTFRAGDPTDFTRVLRGLLDDPAARRAHGECGRKAVLETYHWECDAERLLEAIDAP